jgi:hypothetical protein
MAVGDVREATIDATPEETLNVIADVESTPEWSSQHQGAEESAGQLRSGDAKYTLRREGDKTRVRFEIMVDPSVPPPGFILKRAMTGAMETATDGLRTRVLQVTGG